MSIESPIQNILTESLKASIRDAETRLQNSPALPLFTDLIKSEDTLSYETLIRSRVPELDRFQPVIYSPEGLPMVLVKDGFEIKPTSAPYFIFPDAPSAGGKTSLINNMLVRCGKNAWLIPTVKAPNPSENRTDEKINGTITLCENPFIEGHLIKTGQYVIINPGQFNNLQRIKGFFIERKKHFGSWYGNASLFWEMAVSKNRPFSFSILDQIGTVKMIDWLHKQKQNGHIAEEVRESRWFIQPTDLTLPDLISRIKNSRSKRQVGVRIADAINDMWTSGQDSSIIILNRQETDINHSWRAADATFELMAKLRPDMACSG